MILNSGSRWLNIQQRMDRNEEEQHDRSEEEEKEQKNNKQPARAYQTSNEQ